MSDELKPCPHCKTDIHGGNLYPAAQFHEKWGPWVFDCPGCDIAAEVYLADKGEAIAAWNRRAEPEPGPEGD